MTSNPIPRRDSRSHGEKLGLERLIFFSDAVFAIAVTLLALEIRLPTLDETVSNGELLKNLLAIWPKYLGYVVSFLVIGSLWMGHHRKFLLIKYHDRRLLFLNLILLMSIAFIPFSTSVISEYGNLVTATIFYALSIALAGLFSALVWWYAARNYRLVDDKVKKRELWQELLRPLSVSAVFIASVGLAFINSDLAKYAWMLVLPVTFYIL
jgi:uncharacterized membrane protein